MEEVWKVAFVFLCIVLFLTVDDQCFFVFVFGRCVIPNVMLTLSALEP